MPSGGTLFIEEIQDQVELQLMRREEHSVAKKDIFYTEKSKKRGPVEKPNDINRNRDRSKSHKKWNNSTIRYQSCKDNY